MNRNSFTARLTLRFAALVTATTAAVLVVGGWLLQRQTVSGLELMHEVEGHELAELLGTEANLAAADIVRRIKYDADSDAALFFIQVHKEDGAVLFRSDNLGGAVLPDLSRAEPHWTTRLPAVGDVRVSEFHSGPWHIQVASPLAPTRRLLRDYVEVSGLLVIGVAVTSLGLGYAFSRYTLRPVRAIEATARRIRADNLSERIPVPAGRDELAALAELLNRMFDRLELSFEQVRRFTADASHELKTPLALMQLNAEKLRSRLAGDAEGTAALEDMLEELGRLHQIIESLLFLSKADAGALALELKALSPQALLAALAEDAQALAEDVGARFALSRNEPGEIRGEPNLLRQLLLNLLSNALAVSPPGSLVTLESYWLDGDKWRFEVADEGPGLPEAQLARVFERFVRFEHGAGGAPRSGHGLGLAICKGIAELHRGSIRAENRRDRRGLRVIVELPADVSAGG
ncbi:MAG TPA: ATP-binding protein [Opitutaceae bacterium]